MLGGLLQDIRYAVRAFRRTPAFTAVAVLTLALGIGANTAIFSVVSSVLLRPLPYRQSQQLVRLYEHLPPPAGTAAPPRRLPGMAVRELIALRERSRLFSQAIGHGVAFVTATCGDEVMRLIGAQMSAAAWPMLSVPPALGRWFTPTEEAVGADTVVVLSDSTWQRCFNRDPAVIGRNLTFTGRAPGGLGGNISLNTPFTIVGVMPAGFRFPDDAVQFWTPMALTAPADGRPRRTSMMARIADGVSIEAAADELSAIVRDARGQAAPFEPRRFELVRVQDELSARVKPALLVLTVAVGVVLLIACANVANLLLARAAARRREFAIRVAIGAGRLRLIRQTLTESILLATMGGVAGAALALGGVRLFRFLGTNLPRFDLRTGATFPRLLDVTVDRSVLVFALGMSVATGVLFGLVPALRLSHEAATRDLRGSSAGSRTQGALVVGQLAMATMLLVGGVLLVRSFTALASVDPGYDAENVLTFQVAVPGERGSPAALRTFAEELTARFSSLPGVEVAGYANQLPMVGLRDSAGGLWRTPDPNRAPPPVGPDARFVSRDYLATMGIRVIAGRGFNDGDGFGQPRVLLINQALAKSEFAGEDPIGQRVYMFRSTEAWEIVGVVADVRQFGLDRVAEPQFFVDVRQWPDSGPPLFPGGAYYAIRTKADRAQTVAGIRAAVRQIDPHAALDNFASMDSIVANSMNESRLYAVLLGIFAVIAVAIAAIGVAGVVAYAVAQRTREIGIRMALGAGRGDVVRLVAHRGIVLTSVGIAPGLVAALAATRSLDSMLFGLTARDPTTFVAVAVGFAAVAACASYVPAWRAITVSPLVALRSD